MVLRNDGSRVIALVAACLAATGATFAAFAQELSPPTPPGAVPQGRLVWDAPIAETYVPSVAAPGDAPQPRTTAPQPQAVAPQPPAPPIRQTAAPLPDPAGLMPQSQPQPAATAVPPLGAPTMVDAYPDRFAAPQAGSDPWEGLETVTPGAVPSPPQPLPSYAALERIAPPQSIAPRIERGTLEEETPTNYSPMPRAQLQCRAALQQMGVKFTDASSISSGRSCGIDYPVKVTQIAPGVAMKPAATLNCMTAMRVSQWVSEEVVPSARWKLWKSPVALLNASSYRCSRIAGTGTISEHAKGNALDVRGFLFSDGEIVAVEKKGFFSFGERWFQKDVRKSACRYFGTVLGPGYNYDHRDHFHLDTKKRRRVVCK